MLKACFRLLFCGFAVCAASPFSALVSDYWSWRLEDAPEFASSLDVHTWDDRVEQYTADVIDVRKARVEVYVQRLSAISRSGLSPGEQVSYDVLQDTLDTYLAGYTWKNYGAMNPVNFMEGLWNDPVSYFPTNMTTRSHFFRFATRVFGWADQALNMMIRMRQAMKEKTTNHWVSMTGVLPNIDALIGASVEDNVFVKKFDEMLANSSLSDADRADMNGTIRLTVNYFRQTYGVLKRFILTEYKNETRTSYGVNSFPNGAEYYKACLRWHLSTDQTPEELHQLGRREVERIYGEMTKVMYRLGFRGTVKEFFAMLNANSSFFLKTPEQIVNRFSDILYNRVQPKLSKFFKNIPNMPVKVEPQPFEGPVGMYMSGSPDGSRPGVFYVNTRKPEYNPTYRMVALALHEADPGHHLQSIYALSSPGLEMFRKAADYSKYFSAPTHFPFYNGYAEGWGLYAESLGEKDQLDIYQDDYELMGRYSFEIFRACRLVVDTGIHYYNWTREQGIQYMLNYTAESRDAMTIEIDRYITWPGQACAYKVGELKIKELRARAETALGEQFDIRDFHSVVLENGGMPLRVLEQIVDDWVAQQRQDEPMNYLAAEENAATNVADQFSSLVDEYWEWRLQDAPEFASSIDVHTYDDKVEEYSIDVIDKRKTAVDGYLLRLKQIPRAELVPSDQVSYDVLKDTLETYLAGYRWRYYGPMNPINFLEGLWNDPKANMPDSLKTETQFTNFLLRLDGWTNQVSQMISRMGRAIKEKTTNNWVSMVDAVNQIDALIGNSTEENVFYQAIQEALENSTLSRNKRIQLMTQTNATLVLLRTSYERLNLFIVKEYKNETRAAYGVNSFFDGAEYYKACLRWHLSTDQTPEEVHQLGLREVERILGEMTKVMDRLGFKGTVKEFFSMLNTNSSFFLSPEQTINRFRDIIFNRVKPKLSKFFKNIPNMPVKVEPQPNDGPGGMYMSGSPDGSRPGVFYANVKKPEYNPTYGMVALALHEADPGHHLQDIYAQSSPGLKMFRKTADYTKYFSAPTHFPFYTAYVEGWALYAESLGEKDQLDIYQDDYELMGRYSSEIFRACRLVVDTGLHYYNWSRREGIGYMLNYTAESEDAMTIEIDRYITWPGQACAYKVGELKIKELRARAETALGLQFDIQEFHSVVLHNGAVPLSVLEQIIDDWIARQQGVEKRRNAGYGKESSFDAVQSDLSDINEQTFTPKEKFSSLVDQYWAWRLQDKPEFASAIDVHTYDDKVETYSIDVLDERKTAVDGYLQRLEQIPRVELEPSDQVSYDVLKDTLETYLAGYRWRYYGPMNPVNFLEGIWNDPKANIPDSLTSVKEFTSFLNRLEGWTNQVNPMISRMRRAIQEKTTNHWVSMADAVNQIDSLIGNSTEENVFYMAIQKALENATISQNKKTQLMTQANTTVNLLRAAYRWLYEFITMEYKNETRTAYGVNAFPDGAEYYKACLRWHLSTDQTPEEVHQLGLQEVDRIHAEMVKVVSRLGFNGTVKEFYASLNNNTKFFLNTTDEILARFREIIYDRADTKLSKYFKDIPDMPVKVEPMPNDGPGGSYRFGSPDGSRAGVFYANVKRPEYQPTFMMPVLALHEADPGHHLQDIYSQTAKGLKMFRKVVDDSKYFAPPLHFPFYTAYAEGWGLYSESLGEKDELDIYKDDYELMGRYSHEMFRACRLVVDTGLHYYNWTHDQAVEYILNYTAKSRAAISVEVDRYITWPGQACAYKVGELKIKELRARAQTELGDQFDIRDFHSLILNNGAVPLRVLENLVNDWIAKEKDEQMKDWTAAEKEANIADQFSNLVDEYWAWRLKDEPEFASAIDVPTYDDKVEAYTIDVLDERKVT